MYTIKSTSSDGVYYLCKGWGNHKNPFWRKRNELNNDVLFKRKQDAKTSLYKFLKIMGEYREDSFSIIQIRDINNPNNDVLCDYYYLQDCDFD